MGLRFRETTALEQRLTALEERLKAPSSEKPPQN
jgi:hypothetical protein